jgi:hypothetical protein
MLSQDQILIKSVKSQLQGLERNYIKDLSPQEQHFKEGDIAFVCVDRFDVREVVITEVQDFSEGGKKPGGFIYYWYNFNNIPKFDYFLYKLKYNFYWIIINPILRLFKVKNTFRFTPKIPEYLGPGHAVLAGRGEMLFKTKYEAMLNYHFDWCDYELDNIEYLISDE